MSNPPPDIVILVPYGILVKPKDSFYPKKDRTYIRLGNQEPILDNLDILRSKFLGARFAVASKLLECTLGVKSLQEALAETAETMALCTINGLTIDYAAVCPDFPGNECYVQQLNSNRIRELHTESAYAHLVGTFSNEPPTANDLPGGGMLSALVDLYYESTNTSRPYILPPREEVSVLYIGHARCYYNEAKAAGIDYADIRTVLTTNVT